ncbi:hypothetical protein D3C72_2050300 [compost metagenome]
MISRFSLNWYSNDKELASVEAMRPLSVNRRRFSGLRCSQGKESVSAARSCWGFIMVAFLTLFNHIDLDSASRQGVFKLADICA